jgi:ubiquitin carboxyl-terminal hydrolase 14
MTLSRTRPQRKVKFPFELDALDMVTDALKRKLANANGKVKEIERERAERRKVRKKTKGVIESDASALASTNAQASASVIVTDTTTEDVAMADTQATQDQGKGKEKAKDAVPGELEDEDLLREQEAKEFEASVDPELRADTGASVTGLFELCGE